jgi:hypothetical protein
MTRNAPSAPAHAPPLTGLERELLACVERLTTASEASVAQFAALERRSTGQISERLSALENCFSSLIGSQITLIGAFASLACASNSSATVQQDLDEAERTLKEAAELLSPGSR